MNYNIKKTNIMNIEEYEKSAMEYATEGSKIQMEILKLLKQLDSVSNKHGDVSLKFIEAYEQLSEDDKKPIDDKWREVDECCAREALKIVSDSDCRIFDYLVNKILIGI